MVAQPSLCTHALQHMGATSFAELFQVVTGPILPDTQWDRLHHA